jgi:hypothetical protein
MELEKAQLDHLLLDSLEQLAIREGLISRETEDAELSYSFIRERKNKAIQQKQRLLTIITLFKKIDSNHSGLDWSELIKKGIISQNATMLDHAAKELDNNFFKLKTPEHKLFFDCHVETFHLLEKQKNKIVDFHFRKSEPDFYDRGSSVVSKNDLTEAFDEIIRCILDTDETITVYHKKPHLHYFLNEVYFVWASIRKGIYLSDLTNNTTLTTYFDSYTAKSHQSKIEVVEDIYYTVKTNLKNEIIMLPNPRTIEEAIEFREKKEMHQFREVFSEWIDCVRSGEVSVEYKIRKDLKNANNALKNLKRWKEFKESPINFWLNSIGGHIPLFSNILTVVNSAGYAYEKQAKSKTRWLAMVQKT